MSVLMRQAAFRALLEAAAETVIARYRDSLPREADAAKRDATALLDRRRCTQARSHLAPRQSIGRVILDVSSLLNSPRRRNDPAAGSFSGGAAKALAVVLMLASAPAMAQDGQWHAMPNETRLGVDDQHATCTVDGWWSYNRACCCTHGWCAPIPAHAVREERGGWRVTLRAGEHPRAAVDASWWVPPGGAGRSPDGQYHLCGVPGVARCFLAPVGAM